MTTSPRLSGKSAMITGAGSGLGAATAVRFAQEGAAVACVDLRLEAAEKTAQQVRALGATALAISADVSSAADSEAMVARAVSELGGVDILFANAGIAGTGNAADVTEDLWGRVIDINLKGVWLSSKYLIPHMVERGSGVIINQASMGGLVGIDGIFPYTAAKGGVIAMTKQMAISYGPSGIRVNAICPGTIPTPLVHRSREERGDAPIDSDHSAKDAEVAQRFPLRRLGTPDDVANLALFLASDEANWVTGAIYTVDGGRSAA